MHRSRQGLHGFAQKGDHEGLHQGLRLLGYNVDGRDENGETALFLASTPACVAILLENGAATAPVDGHDTALHALIRRGYTDSAVALITQRPFLCGVRNSYSQSPAHVAVEYGNMAVLRAITASGCAALDMGPNYVLRAALDKGNDEMARILLEGGANPILAAGRPLPAATDPAGGRPRGASGGGHARIRNLVFQGGGVRGIAYVGALKRLEQRRIVRLADVQRVAGTSAGAIAALVVGLGCDMAEMEEIMKTLNVLSLLDEGPLQEAFLKLKSSCSSLEDMLRAFVSSGNVMTIAAALFGGCGLFSGDAFEQWADALIARKTGGVHHATFRDVQGRPHIKDMRFIATSITRRRPQVFSFAETPDVVISCAVRCSMSIPGVFRPVSARGKAGPDKSLAGQYFVDGGLLYNYPLEMFDSRIDGVHVINHETLGLRLVSSQSPVPRVDAGPPSLLSLASDLTSVLVNHELTLYERSSLDERSISIDDLGVSCVDFDLTDEVKMELQLSGERAVDTFDFRVPRRLSPPLTQLLVPNLQYEAVVLPSGKLQLREPRVTHPTPQFVLRAFATTPPDDDAQALRFLAAAGVSVHTRDAKTGATAVHVALDARASGAPGADADVAAALRVLTHMQRDATDNDERTPLDAAVETGDTAAVHELWERGCRTLHIENFAPLTLMDGVDLSGCHVIHEARRSRPVEMACVPP